MRPRIVLAIAFLLLVAACVPLAGAENAAPGARPDQLNPRHFDGFWLGYRVDLGPDWLFAADDNPAYAAEGYDDSSWKTISAAKQLSDYGVRNVPYAWYRMHVHVDPQWTNLAVEVQSIEGSYELYVNGVRIGAHGKMNGMLYSAQPYLASYDVPDSMIAPKGDLVLAIRFAINKWVILGAGTPLGTGGVLIANREQ